MIYISLFELQILSINAKPNVFLHATWWYKVSWKTKNRQYKLKPSRNVLAVDPRRAIVVLISWRYNCQSASDWMNHPQQPSSPAKTTKVDIKHVLHHPQLPIIHSFSVPTYSFPGSWGVRRLFLCGGGSVHRWCIEKKCTYTTMKPTAPNLHVFRAEIQILDPPVVRKPG